MSEAATRVLYGLKGRFVFGKARERFLEEKLDYLKYQNKVSMAKRNNAIAFAKDFITAPLFTKVDVRDNY